MDAFYNLFYDYNCTFNYSYTDVNECVMENDCHRNSDCVNNVGSYDCNCLVGFTGNGTECTGMFYDITKG